MLSSHRYVKASLWIHTRNSASVSVFLQSGWSVFFLPRCVLLSASSELSETSLMAGRRGRQCFYLSASPMSSFLWDPFWERSKWNSATAMMSNASWLKKQDRSKLWSLAGKTWWEMCQAQLMLQLRRFGAHFLSTPARKHITNILTDKEEKITNPARWRI